MRKPPDQLEHYYNWWSRGVVRCHKL